MIRNKFIIVFFSLSFVFLVISTLVGMVGLPKEAGGPLIFRFNKFGNQADLFGGFGTFFWLVGVILGIILINLWLTWEIYHRERFLSYIIAVATALISFIFLVVASVIAAIN